MYGFTESFNISVAAALTLRELSSKMLRREGVQWALSKGERDALMLAWYRHSIRGPFEERVLEGERQTFV